MTGRPALLNTVVAAAVGFGAAAVTLGVGSSDAVEATTPAGSASAETVAPRTPVAPAALSAVSRRGAPPPMLEDQAPLPEPAAVAAYVERTARSRAAAHAAEASDRVWAKGAERRVLDALATIADRTGFEDPAVDCRTNLCRIDLTWGDYEHAEEDSGRLLTALHDVPCAIHAPLPRPDEPGRPYRSATYLDCSRARADQL